MVAINRYYLLSLFLLFFGLAKGQTIRINEVMSVNNQTIFDEDGDTPDWIELYNYGSETINLEGFSLYDSPDPEDFWTFPSFELMPDQYLIVFASDKNRLEPPMFWETVIDQGDEWQYIVPDSEPTGDWRSNGFDDSAWLSGKTSIGYGDNDDSTLVEDVLSVYLRKTFTITSAAQISDVILHVDYDDGFVAFLNGVEIARSGLSGQPPAFNEAASNHESLIHSGGLPEAFELTNVQDLLLEGANVLAVQVHNTGAGSSDMTIIPILSFGSTFNRGAYISTYLNLNQGSFHSNFKLSSSGETIFLSNQTSDVIDNLLIPELSADLSFGSNPDGANNAFYFNEPTPGKPNSTNTFSTISGEVVFEQPGGVYASSIQVTINTLDPIGNIYYTTDGSEPTELSLLYTGSFEIASSTSIRARLISDGALPGKMKTVSYLIGVSHTLPIISLTVDPYEFFDETVGMYSKGPNASADFPYWDANFWQDWEKPIHVEMYETDGSLAFSANAGAKIFGAYSRGNDQKSLSIFFRKSYGDGPLDYQFFPEKNLKEYSSIILRNSGNDWNNTMMRDGLLTSLFHKSVDKQAYRPAVIYINGEYWGIQNIREKVNEHFLANNHAIDSDSIEILEYSGGSVLGSEQHYKNLINYVTYNKLSSTENYEYVKTQMDVMNYIYYMSANVFINNYDWPASNIKFWRETSNEGKWRWIAYDKDAGFGIWDGDSYSENRLTYIMHTSNSWPNPSWATLLFRSLVVNTDFKNKFINTYADQLNSTWLSTAIQDEIDEKKSVIEGEISSHLNRWDGNYNYWNEKVNEYDNYAFSRPIYASRYIEEEFNLSGTYTIQLNVSDISHGTIRINTLFPKELPWEGSYFNDIPIELEALPSPGYRFIEWEGIDSEKEKATLSSTDDLNVVAHFQASSLSIEEVLGFDNFPNPFSEETQIHYEIQQGGEVSLSVFNLNGKRVELLQNGFQEEGKHEINWQPKGLSPGIYILKLRDGDKISIRKIVLL